MSSRLACVVTIPAFEVAGGRIALRRGPLRRGGCRLPNRGDALDAGPPAREDWHGRPEGEMPWPE